ncbi:DUF1640 domain-containing protein [Parahaliea maris]|uniref:DUF1640 domain-containing protein n=1 Tax=Parahaliea maris TaxID=2716870 RepID=A0A5C8ZQY1_9GAMM|nr:DUF1640 domain-containing protein [Parahaliea maris]TXS90868.1 DUF1640 domain-containing protein [Parahaliea maris]
MAAIAFDTLKCSRRLIAAGVPEQQADVLAELMAEAFVYNVDQLVTKDYLDARLDTLEQKFEARFTVIEGKFRLLYWMMGVVIATTVLPALTSFFAPG